MKKVNRAIWGIVLATAGVLFALNALEITNIDIFFDGWWTLFILVPSFVGLFTERDKTGNIIGLLVGVFLLLCSRDILDFSMVWKLLLPIIIFFIGAKMFLGAIFSKKKGEGSLVKIGRKDASCCTIFSGREYNWNNRTFEGTELVTIFGGIDCNLKNAIIEHDCTIDAVCIFGGIDILVPNNVNVEVSSVSIFGGVDNLTSANPDAPTVTVNCVCLFGGIDIK